MAWVPEPDIQSNYGSRAELGFPSAEFGDRGGIAHGERLSNVLVWVAVLEFAVDMLVFGMTSFAYYCFVLNQWPPPRASQYLLAALFIAASVVIISVRTRQFSDISSQRRRRFLWNGAGAVALAFSFLLSTMFLLKVSDGYSRGTLFFQFITVSIVLLGLRTIVHRKLQAAIVAGQLEMRRLIAVGNPSNCLRFADRLQGTGVHLGASFPFPANVTVHHIPGPVANAGPKDAEVQTIIDASRALRIDDIVILPDVNELASIPRLANVLAELPVALHILPSSLDALLRSARVTHLGGVSTGERSTGIQ